MRVRDVLRIGGGEVVSVTPSHTLADVTRLFRERNIGFVLVQRPPQECLGTVSERNCCHAIAEHGTVAASLPVAQFMNGELATCSIDDPLPTVMAIMTERRTRHVLVLNGGELAGLVSIGDLVKHRLDESLRIERELENYIAGTGFR